MAIEKRTGSDGKPRYLVRIEVRTSDGTRTQRRVGTFRKKVDAEQAESKAKTERDSGTLLDPAKTTVAQLLTDWLRHKAGEISPNAHSDYEVVIRKYITPGLGAIPIQRLTAAQLQSQYTAWRDAGLSPRQIRGCHLRLSAALDYAVRTKLISTNPARDARPPKLPRATVNIWSPAEAARFLEAARICPFWPLWPLLLIEGMRRGEGLGLRWQDVDLERGTATIRQTVTSDKSAHGRTIIQSRTKTRSSSRTIALTALTITALRDHRTRWVEAKLAAPEWIDHDLIICTGKGTPVSPANVQRAFTRLIAMAGVPRIRLHDLRHTAASLALRTGANLKQVSDRLGHAGIAITADYYAHLSDRDRRNTADAVAELIAAARSETGTG